MTEILPWHQSQWQEINRRLEGQRLPHALLLTGAAGLGKLQFAVQLAHRLLCQSPTPQGQPCTNCKSCQLFSSGNHPDVYQIVPPEDKTQISIDQIRELCEDFYLTPQLAGYRLAIITPAEAMNHYAANSLLKTLEEPAGKSLLILVSHQPGSLPATIRSRCQRLGFAKPRHEMAIDWLTSKIDGAADAELLLAMADGAPCRAFEMADNKLIDQRVEVLKGLEAIVFGQQDPVSVAERWLKLDAKTSLYWLYSWIVDMTRLQCAEQPPYLSNPDIRQSLKKISTQLRQKQLYQHMDRTIKALANVEGSLNTQLLLEDMLIPWQD